MKPTIRVSKGVDGLRVRIDDEVIIIPPGIEETATEFAVIVAVDKALAAKESEVLAALRKPTRSEVLEALGQPLDSDVLRALCETTALDCSRVCSAIGQRFDMARQEREASAAYECADSVAIKLGGVKP